MADTFTFPATPTGEALRANLVNSLEACGITFTLSEEDITHHSLTFHVLKLVKTGKRPNEGKIASEMKERKALRD